MHTYIDVEINYVGCYIHNDNVCHLAIVLFYAIYCSDVLIHLSSAVANPRHAFLLLVNVGLNGLAALTKRGREAD
jgi:hypothetical protein